MWVLDIFSRVGVAGQDAHRGRRPQGLVGRESPAIARRQLAAELRRLRHSAEKTLEEVAEILGCTAGKISRLETGIVRVQPQDVSSLLDIYAVPADRRQALLTLLRESRKREWWHSYADIVPRASSELYSLEAASTGIQDYSHALVPGLLQTEQYARAIIGSFDAGESRSIDRRIELRMRRQELLTANDAPVCTFLIDEVALRRRVGGPQVRVGQIERLLDVGARSNVTIRIVPNIAHPAAGASFIIFGFAPSEHRDLAFIETLTRNIFIDEPDEVRLYGKIFMTISGISLSPEDSRRLLKGSLR
jgi:transcriptional regulator with XRE-family HTH domain